MTTLNTFRISLHGAGEILNSAGNPVTGTETDWLVRAGNACAGMADPAAELAELRADLHAEEARFKEATRIIGLTREERDELRAQRDLLRVALEECAALKHRWGYDHHPVALQARTALARCKEGLKLVRAVRDAAGNCVVCGEAGRCPGWHAEKGGA